MFWLASLFGLMAMGGVMFVADGESDSDQDGTAVGPTSPETDVTIPDLLPTGGSSEGDDILSGTSDGDDLNGGDGIDQINGYGGDDLLDGGNGDDIAHGGQGNDTLHVDGGDDALHGNYGDDTLFGGAGVDTLFGGLGEDLISGADDTGERDYINGGDGDDTLVAGANDVLTLGDGEDQVIVGSWINGDDAIELVDFDSSDDQLVLLWDMQNQPDPDIEIEAVPEAPDQSIIRINGAETLRVNTSAGITEDDIVLLDQTSSALPGLLPF